MPAPGRRRIGEALLVRGLITEDELQGAIDAQNSSGARLGTVLITAGLVSRLQLYRVLAEEWGVPFTDLERELLAESLYKVRVLFDQIEHTVNAATDAERAEMRSLRALAGAVDQIEQDFQRDAMQDRIRRLQRAIRGDDDQREE